MPSTLKKLILGSEIIEYTHRKTRRAKRLRLIVYCDATVVVSTPRYVSGKYVESYLTNIAKEWLLAKTRYFKKLGRGWKLKGNREEYLRLKSSAYAVARDTVERINRIYNFAYKKISIRNQKLRWGSCSKSGTLTFNYRIIFLTPLEQEYLVAHELAHLRELNHSSSFWELVAKAAPNYKVSYKSLNNKMA